MKRSTLVALAVLLVLVGVVYWLEREDASGTDTESVFDVAEADIVRVEIERDDNEPVIIERDGEHFHFAEPEIAAIDETEVELVLSNLATMSAIRTFAREESSDPKEFGLDSPSLEVRFATGDGRERWIRFGKDTLTGSSQYAARDGSDDVMIVANYLARNLGKSAWDLRDKAIFHLPDDAEPTRVKITRGNQLVELQREGDLWFTATGPRSRVDRFEVTGMVARFRRAEMLELSDISIDEPSIRLDVEFADGVGSLALEIGEKQNVDYIARVPAQEQVFLFEGGLVRELEREPPEWWSKKLLHHATTESTVTTVQSGGNERTMSRDEAQELLRALSDATAEKLVSERPSGDPAYVIVVSTEEAQDTIALYRTEGKIYATRQDEEIALILPDEARTAIQTALSKHPPDNR